MELKKIIWYFVRAKYQNIPFLPRRRSMFQAAKGPFHRHLQKCKVQENPARPMTMNIYKQSVSRFLNF
jgi:hypothetical protein